MEPWLVYINHALIIIIINSPKTVNIPVLNSLELKVLLVQKLIIFLASGWFYS